MTAQQQRFLLNRLDAARSNKPKHYESVFMTEPPKVKDARKVLKSADRIISRWEKRKRKVQDQRNQHISQSFQNARTTILFGEPKAALKAVEKFEATTF